MRARLTIYRSSAALAAAVLFCGAVTITTAEEDFTALVKRLQQEKPQDFVIATGQQYSVRDFVRRCAELLDLNLTWQGTGVSN